MTISASIITDSISPNKIRLTTLQLRYPRFIHAEFMTHRVFSRNASSSRAVPVKKLIEDIKRDTAMPIYWGKNQKGMQADEECNEPIMWFVGSQDNMHSREDEWLAARDDAIRRAERFDKAGYHKQIVNRLLEPFSHINVLVTSTDWANFFHLRDHKDAQPEICYLAQIIKAMMNGPLGGSIPNPLKPGEWHLPYITEEDRRDLSGNTMFMQSHETDFNGMLCMASVARCARVSYLTYEGKKPNLKNDLDLYYRLVGGNPLHASPAEHQATPDDWLFTSPPVWQHPHEHGNFKGWRQYRKMLPNECVND